MTDPNLFNQLLIWPIVNLLIGFYRLFENMGIPGALGFAVISMTVLIRLFLHPLTVSQIKNARKMADLKPELDKLSKKYKDDKIKLQQEQLKIYQQVGINPGMGCLPLLIQFPILIALYRVFFDLLSNGEFSKSMIDDINKILYHPSLYIEKLDLAFFGANLAIKPSDWPTSGVWLLSVPVATGVLQYFQTKLMSVSSPGKEIEKKKKKIKKEKKDEDLGTMMQKQMSVMMPLMIGFFSYSFPLGLSLYWNTFTIFGIIQQYKINKETEQEDGKKK